MKTESFSRIAGTFIFLMLVSCCGPKRIEKHNQKTPLPSPSGEYVLEVGIEKIEDSHYWMLRIEDREGNPLYVDEDGFPAQFNVYWMWDQADRVWFYNSDDGKVYCWLMEGNQWFRILWGAGRKNLCGLDMEPPEELYPDYVN